MSIFKGTTLLAGSPVTIPLFTHIQQDHIVNDISWLRADTFSWQSGDVYTRAYQHLVDDLGETETIVTYYSWYYEDYDVYTLSETPSPGDNYYTYIGEAPTGTIDSVGANTITINGTTWQRDSQDTPTSETTYNATRKTETIAGTTITYYQASDGHKIVLADQEINVISIYAATGTAWYYILDTTNTRFKLPRENGMHLYFYIGQFTQTAIQQTAGINGETLNSKVDASQVANLCMPDYARCVAGGLIGAGTWIQTPKDAQVVVWGTDPYTENYNAYVSPNSGQTQYQVGYRYDDTNSNTEGTSFCFLVPKNWYFTCNVEQGFHYRIYPLKGAN